MNRSDRAPDGVFDQGELVDSLVQAAFVTMAVLTEVAGDNEVSLTQLRVFGILRDRRVGVTALANYLGLEKSTMTGLVGRAEKRGLLQRAPNPADGRAVDVFLTAAGAELVERVHGHIARTLAPMTDALGPAEQRRLDTLLRRVLDSGPS
ncbi:MarR family winged helix-turn-helix transcriptional regulator [Nocardia sp. BMG111209]|uniref:MarR family winged helix-turn-helix transcriptional regulator n=1 Tax=Nocardia sp. BMG111209 TaxID=1160137 RepID=UPI000379AED8|nr:MarR family transcriptional regulator [Nocardia sp. BMG111209]